MFKRVAVMVACAAAGAEAAPYWAATRWNIPVTHDELRRKREAEQKKPSEDIQQLRRELKAKHRAHKNTCSLRNGLGCAVV